jgi:hypothetical protein
MILRGQSSLGNTDLLTVKRGPSIRHNFPLAAPIEIAVLLPAFRSQQRRVQPDPTNVQQRFDLRDKASQFLQALVNDRKLATVMVQSKQQLVADQIVDRPELSIIGGK